MSNFGKPYKKKEPASEALRKKTIPDRGEEVTYEDGVPSTLLRYAAERYGLSNTYDIYRRTQPDTCWSNLIALKLGGNTQCKKFVQNRTKCNHGRVYLLIPIPA